MQKLKSDSHIISSRLSYYREYDSYDEFIIVTKHRYESSDEDAAVYMWVNVCLYHFTDIIVTIRLCIFK